jgi:hypothetical protein
MRALNISLGGLKLEANTDLHVGESLHFAIDAKGTKIHCRGKILAAEEVNNKVQARLSLVPASDSDKRKLSDYLRSLYWGRYEKWIIAGILMLSAYIFYVIIRT